MKKTLIALIAIALMSIGAIAMAGEAQIPSNQPVGPVVMTDTQMDNVVAGYPSNAWGHYKTWTDAIQNPDSVYDDDYPPDGSWSARPLDAQNRGKGKGAYFYND